MSSAPKTPCSARARTSSSTVGAIAHSSEATPNPATPDREHAPLAVQVGERAGDEDQRREREQIGVRHPLLAGEPAAEVVGDRRQRDVDGRGVHCHHGRPQDGRRESAALGVHLRRTLQSGTRSAGASSVRAMLAYVFWHVPYAGIARPDYEDRLAAFHAALRAHPPAWLGLTATFGLADGPVAGRRGGVRGLVPRRGLHRAGRAQRGGGDRRPAAAPRRRRGRRRARRRRGHGPCRRTAAAGRARLEPRGSPSPPAGAMSTSTPSWRALGASGVAAPDGARPGDGVLRARARAARAALAAGVAWPLRAVVAPASKPLECAAQPRHEIREHAPRGRARAR